MKKMILACLFLGLISCHKTVQNEVEVYNNNFENADIKGISNAVINNFNGTKVLGQYTNSGFGITVTNLPKHDLVTISFDLYIHDSWDGNQTDPSGPDIWQMLLDGETLISTTFSNVECQPGNFCPPQSYPSDYPNNNNNPRAGAANVNLPGVCVWKAKANGSTLYKINKTVRHSKSSLILQCLDKLVQKGITDPSCDESWSVDNVQIKAITI